MRIFSGIQPTGAKHFGNYSGGFRQYAATQEQAAAGGGVAFFCIVDLHSVTVDYDPADLHERTLDLAALLYATGLDPGRSTVFAQSHVTAHAEASWLLAAVTSYGQLGRMTQFKEKGDRQEVVTAASSQAASAWAVTWLCANTVERSASSPVENNRAARSSVRSRRSAGS